MRIGGAREIRSRGREGRRSEGNLRKASRKGGTKMKTTTGKERAFQREKKGAGTQRIGPPMQQKKKKKGEVLEGSGD